MNQTYPMSKEPKEQANDFLGIFSVLFRQYENEEMTQAIREKLNELQDNAMQTKKHEARHQQVHGHEVDVTNRIIQQFLAATRTQVEWLEMITILGMQYDKASKIMEDVLRLLIMHDTKNIEKKLVDRERDVVMSQISAWLEQYDKPWYNPLKAKEEGRSPHESPKKKA